jgi:Spy/CpxP family protein refolding chaperone
VKSIHTWRTLGIAVAMAGVLGMMGGLARADEAATAPAHPRGEHGRFIDNLSGRIDQALDAASATDKQKAAIGPARDRLIDAMKTAKQDAKDHRGELLTLFEGDKLTAVQLRKFRSDRKSRFQPVMDASDNFLRVAHDTLRPEQRKSFAESLKATGFFGGGPQG